jgi:hypothetical protein
MEQNITPARLFARLILMIGMISSGFAAIFALSSSPRTALYICGGGLVVAALVLLVGGYLVASRGGAESDGVQ